MPWLFCIVVLLLCATASIRAADPVVSFAGSPSPISEDETARPFEDLMVNDTDTDETVVVRITFPAGRGSFQTNMDLSRLSDGVYELREREPADAESFLNNLVFTPDRNHIADGVDEVTTFTVRATDSTARTAQDSVDLTVTGINTAPVLVFTGSNPPTVNDDDATGTPFANINISDADAGDTVTVQITFSSNRGTFPLGAGLTSPSPGNYVLDARSASDAETFMRGLTFTPAKNRIPLGETETTTFTVSATDGSGASDSDTEDQRVRPVNDAPRLFVSLPGTALLPIPDNRPTNIFLSVVIEEDDVARYSSVVGPQHVIVDITLGEGAQAVGSFTNPITAFGTNQLIISGTPSSVITALRNWQFLPRPNRKPVDAVESTVIPIALTDDLSLAATNNGDRSIYIKSINDAPTLTTSLFPATTSDTVSISPFHATVNDPDPNDTIVLTIEPTNSTYGFINPPGPFTGTKSAIEAAVSGVRFTPVANSVSASSQLPFHFRLVDNHGIATNTTNNLTITGVNDAPDIAGISGASIHTTDDPGVPPVHPFPTVRIVDGDDAGLQQQTVTITLSDSSKGTLSTNRVTGTPDEVTAALRAITFKPALRPDRVLNQSVSVTLTINVVDSGGLPRSDDRTIISITSVNGAPQITGTHPLASEPKLISPNPPLKPFNEVSIADDDMTNVIVTLTIDNPAKGTLSNLGSFVSKGSGIYKMTNLPAVIVASLTNIQFELNSAYLFPPNAPGGTKFTIEAVDYVLNRTASDHWIIVQSEPLNHFVTRTQDDENAGSLRHALLHAGNNDVVTFALEGIGGAAAYPALIRLDKNLGPIVLRRNVTLRGPGADILTISGDTEGNLQPDTQLFRIFAGVTMDGVTLTRGIAQGTNATGGAIYVGPVGELTLRNCAVTDCRAMQWGGAIDVDRGALTLQQCFLARNKTDEAQGLGGGAVSLYTTQQCAFGNTTFSSNRQQSSQGIGGGALYAENFDPSRALNIEVTHCTFAENSDASFGASSLYANVFGTFAVLHNSIFADNQNQNLESAGGAEVISHGGNVSDDNTRTVLTQGGEPQSVILLDQVSDRIDATVRLAPLSLLLRPTPAYPLQSGSPAIGLAVTPDPPAAATDQRGVIRTNRNDSGALEFEATERLVLNEIHFDPAAGQSDFLEFYVTRDSVPVDLSGFTVDVDGTNRHTFRPGTIVQPGQGIILADTNIAVVTSSFTPTPVAIATNRPLNLQSRGRVELKKRDGGPVIDVSYIGIFADLVATTQAVAYANNSLTLAPQFRGAAYLPHSSVLGGPLGGADITRNPTNNTTSPGADAAGTPFGSPNELPLAADDEIIVGEDTPISVTALDNDLDADGLDELVIIDVSRASAPGSGATATTNSALGATVTIDPSVSPLRGTNIIYDPRGATNLQSLPEGAELTDQFYYEIIDVGTGPILSYSGAASIAPLTIVSPGHRLTNDDRIIISGAGIATYNGEYTVTRIDNDSFSVVTNFQGDVATRGSWVTKEPRHPSQSSQAKVTITVIGANDPPTPAADTTFTDEETIIRIMADAALAGSATQFSTDSQYPQPPIISPVRLLANDTDPDTDDSAATLKVIGVVGAVNSISNYTSTNDGAAVLVSSPGHGLADGAVILISGYGGYPSYNGYHAVVVVNADSFVIPIAFVDNNATRGAWVILNDNNRLSATSKDGAAVQLEIRIDHIETSIVYNPRTSAFLNGLTVGETNADLFYYAVQDRHGAITLAPVTVRVAGVDDAPQPIADPSSLAVLNPLITPSNSLDQVLAQLNVLYALPPSSGLSNRTDIQVLSSTNTDALSFFLTDIWTTDEDTRLDIPAPDLLSNDQDIDRTDGARLAVKSVGSLSQAGAAISLNTNAVPPVITYDPTLVARLNMLAREETLMDTFEVTVTDTHSGGDVTTLVAVLVIGANDKPVAQPDFAFTPEDVSLFFGPPGTSVLDNDFEADINGLVPDNRLRLLPVTDVLTPGGARVTTLDRTLNYDPRFSALLDGLGVGQTYTDRFEYVAMDGSFLFANNDNFKVIADGADFELTVLANDRNLTGVGHPVLNYSGEAGAGPVTVTATAHGLSSGMAVAIAGYGGLGLYNQVHLVTVVDENTFTIPVLFVDNPAIKGTWSRLTITALAPPNRGGTITTNDTASTILYTPEINFVGDESFAYKITDEMGDTDTAIVTVRVTVNQLNGNLQANADSFTVAKGQSPLLDVLANDNALPDAGGALTITRIVSQPVPPDHVVLSNNSITFVQESAGPFPYFKTFSYEVSGGGTARAIAEVTVAVVDRENTLNIRSDTFAVQAGSLDNFLDVLANDNILPANAGALTIADFAVRPAHGDGRINEDGTALIYTPTPGFFGQDRLVYMATDGLGGTGTGAVTIAVGNLTTANDFFVVPYDDPATTNDNGAVLLDVLANDVVLQGPAASNIVIKSVSPTNTALGTMRVQLGGAMLLFDVTEGVEGETNFTYTILDGSGRTALGNVTVAIIRSGVKANADAFTVAADSSVNTLDVLANDAAIPDFGQPLTIVSIGTGLDAPNHGGSVVINATSDRLVYTPAAGFLGEETFTYTMTDARKTDRAKVVIRVTSGALTANDDAFTVFFQTASRTFTLPVLANDRVVPDAGEVLTITGVGINDINGTNAPDQHGSVEISPDGLSLLYVPRDTNGPFPYIETFTYEISDGTARRAQAVARVAVYERTNARDLETSDDAFSVLANSENNVLAVLVNDDVKPASASDWEITDVSVPVYRGVVAIIGQNLLYTPQTGFVGTDEFTYTVSDGLGGTGHATVRVKVGDEPLSDDLFSVISGSANNILNVLANDAIRPDTGDAFQLLAVGAIDHGGSASVSNGVVLYTPQASFAGPFPYTERFFYIVADDSGLTTTGKVAVTVFEPDSDRHSAILTIRVDGVNDAPTITGITPGLGITDKESINPFPSVLIGDVDEQGQQVLTVTISLDDPAKGVLRNLAGFVPTSPGVYTFTGRPAQVTLAIQKLVFDPTDNRITVPTSEDTHLTLSVVDGYVVTPVTTNTTVTVTPVNDPPVIAGTRAGQTVYQRMPIHLFSGVTITEVDDLTLQPLQITVTVSDPTHGFLTDLGGFTDQGGGVYSLGSPGVTAAAASAALRGMMFVPTTGNRVLPDQPETTGFTISVNDGFAPAVLDTNTSVVAIHEFVNKALANDGVFGDNFGTSVSASRDIVVIGAPFDDDRGTSSGAVYVYARSNGPPLRWVQIQKIVPADGAAGDEFGSAVSIDANMLAIGARGARVTASAGVAYLYSRNPDNTFTLVKKVSPSDGANTDEFGFAVSLSGDTLAVGAHLDDDHGNSSGSVYLFRRDHEGVNNWGQVRKITPGDGASGDQFGYSVGLDGDLLVVGAPFDTHNGFSSGSAYLFGRNEGGTTNWGQIKKLLPSDGLNSDQFGSSVSIKSDTIVIGAPRNDQLGNDTGAAYIFNRDEGGAGNWGQLRKLLGPDSLNNDQFGNSVSISRDKILVGAPLTGIDNQSKYGSAYAFARNQGGSNTWGLLQKLERTDPANNDEFGAAVAVGDDTVVVGARLDDDRGGDSGTAYIYRLKYNNGPQIATTIPDQIAVVGVSYSFSLLGLLVDPDYRERLTFTAASAGPGPAPAWLGFDPVTATLSGVPTAAGIHTIVVTATDEEDASATASFEIKVIINTALPGLAQELWLLQHFDAATLADAGQEATVWGNAADPDHDGLNNLAEYFFGSDPLQAPPGGIHALLSIAKHPDGNHALISYQRRTNEPRFTYCLQSSPDLVNWSTAGIFVDHESAVAIDGGLEVVTLQIHFSSAPAQFFRIKVE